MDGAQGPVGTFSMFVQEITREQVTFRPVYDCYKLEMGVGGWPTSLPVVTGIISGIQRKNPFPRPL